MGPVKPPLHIVIADDDALVRRTLTERLALDPDLAVAAQCTNGSEVLAFIRAHPPAVVLMDLDMPVMDGLTATRAIRQANLPIRVIALTNYDDNATVSRAFAAGVDGCLAKTTPLSALVHTVKAVARSEIAVMPASAIPLVCHRAAIEIPGLSEREMAVLRLIASGQPVRLIAGSLIVSASTVKADLRSMEGKFGVKGRVLLATRAHQLGLL